MARDGMDSFADDEKDLDNESILDSNVKKVNEWYSYYGKNIDRARNFLTFLYVDQWDSNIRQAREFLSRPTMEFNKVTSIVRSILGEQRNNSPALTVRGIGKSINQDTVNVYDGLVRQIHYDSDADIVYQVAAKHALECGWGAARVIAEYEGPDTFNQCLKIKPIMDFQAAFWDPVSQESDRSDGDYCGVYTIMSKDKYRKLYKDFPNPEEVTGITNNYYVSWSTRDTVMIAEIYYKEYFTKKLVQLSDGNELDYKKAKEVLDMQQQMVQSNPDLELMGFEPLTIENEREVRDYKIKHMKFVQNHVLEETDYPGKILPIVYIEGDSTYIDGEQIPIPYIQDAIDTQKLINYIGSEMAYAILRSRKETVIGTPENFAGFEEDWINPDRVQGFLNFNYDRNGGKPEFITPPAFNPAFMQAYNNSSQDLMQILGRFEESRGQETNAISGVAINARQRAANKPVNVYSDNLQRGIRHIGKIIIDMIPHIYDTERTVMIMTPDNKSKAATINQQNGYNMLPNGQVEPNVKNDVTKGKYDIDIRVDGSYDAQQAQAMDTLLRLAQMNPQISNLIPDLIAQVSGLENSQQLVERLKTLVPPEILAKEEGKPLPPPPPPQQNPMMMVQMGKLKNDEMKNQISMQELGLKAKQQALDEQKLMLDGQLAGLDSKNSFVKASTEIKKANIQKDIAILSHANTLHSGNL
jgi:hypothetical protein